MILFIYIKKTSMYATYACLIKYFPSLATTCYNHFSGNKWISWLKNNRFFDAINSSIIFVLQPHFSNRTSERMGSALIEIGKNRKEQGLNYSSQVW